MSDGLTLQDLKIKGKNVLHISLKKERARRNKFLALWQLQIYVVHTNI